MLTGKYENLDTYHGVFAEAFVYLSKLVPVARSMHRIVTVMGFVCLEQKYLSNKRVLGTDAK